jgi:hypothetical protein
MNLRPVVAALLAVAVAVSAIELSTWVLGRAISAVVPAASVSEVDAHVPQASEIDPATPSEAPAITW